MEIGLYHSCFFEWDVETTFAWMEAEGFSHAELYGGPRYPFIDWDDVADGRVDAIMKSAERHGITIHDIMYGALGFLDPEPSVREHAADYLKKLILAAKNLGASSVSTFTGRDPDLDFEANLAKIRKTFEPLIEFAAHHGVKVLLENCPMAHDWPPKYNIAVNPDMWALIFHELDSDYFGLNLDPSHLVWQGIDYVDAVYRFRDKIHIAQAKDSQVMTNIQRTRGTLDGRFWRHRIAGHGDVDWNRFVAALVDIGYDKPLFIEHEDPFFSRDTEAVARGVQITRQNLLPFAAMTAIGKDYSETKEKREEGKKGTGTAKEYTDNNR